MKLEAQQPIDFCKGKPNNDRVCNIKEQVFYDPVSELTFLFKHDESGSILTDKW